MIRRATPEDADGIAAVEVRTWRHAYADIIEPQDLAELDQDERAAAWNTALAQTDRVVYVAEVEDRIVGYTSVRDDGSLRTLYVDPLAQGAGVGTRLLAQAEQAGARELEVLAANGHGIRFYEARGWHDSGEGEPCLGKSTRRYVR